MKKHSMEWNEILGDAIADVEQSEIHEAIAYEQQLTEADLDDWYAQLVLQDENYQDHKKERSVSA